MRKVLPEYVFKQRYRKFIFLEDSGPSTHVIEELIQCVGPVDIFIYDERADQNPALELTFVNSKEVADARTHADTWYRMGPVSELYTETSQWGVYASLSGEITVLGYNHTCESHAENLREEYESLIWPLETSVDIMMPFPYHSELEREAFKQKIRQNYSDAP